MYKSLYEAPNPAQTVVMTSISSRQNPLVKTWCSLTDARGVRKSRRALIAGRKIVANSCGKNSPLAEALLVPPKFDPEKLPQFPKTFQLSAPLFKEIDVLGTKAPILVAKIPELPAWQEVTSVGLELIVALSDPGNLGALLRSVEAFGVRRVILTEEACSPFLPKVTRAASGANFRVAMCTTGQLHTLKVAGAYGLDMNGESLLDFNWPENLRLILGEEGRGIPLN